MNKKQWIEQTARVLGTTMAQARHLTQIELHRCHRVHELPVMAGGRVFEGRKRRQPSDMVGRPPAIWWEWERQDSPRAIAAYPR